MQGFRKIRRPDLPEIGNNGEDDEDYDAHYKNLARELQRRESDLVILGVCDRVRRELPQCPLISVHDSLMTTAEYLPTIERFMHEAFVGFEAQPSFHVEKP